MAENIVPGINSEVAAGRASAVESVNRFVEDYGAPTPWIWGDVEAQIDFLSELIRHRSPDISEIEAIKSSASMLIDIGAEWER